MIIDHVNLNHIRVFESVFRSKSMTLAARELHLTQSGVSQHIKSLEDMLGVKLFDRIQQRLVPTAAGTILFKRCSQGLHEIEQALWAIKGEGSELAGNITIGMPIEFGNNVILPLLSSICRKYPRVQLKLHLDFASVMNQMLLNGELDFAFVDNFQMNRRIRTEKVYDETLELCATEDFLKRFGAPKNTRKFFEAMEFVEYQEEEPVLRMWFAHHLGTRHIELNVRTTVMDVQAIARLILSGVGAGILPSHLVEKLRREGKSLYCFKGCGKPLKNEISVAYLSDRTHAPSTLTVLDSIRKSLCASPESAPPKTSPAGKSSSTQNSRVYSDIGSENDVG